LHTPGETPDALSVWVPKYKAAFVGDNVYDSFPNIYTLRGTTPRWALDYVASIDKILALSPEVVLPSLDAGTCVLSERFVDASIAYQGYGRQLPIEVVRRVNDVATRGVRPDLTLLIDIEPASGLARARNAHGKGAPAGRGDRLEQEDLAFHERVRAGFLQLAREEPSRFAVVDGSRSRDEVHAALVTAVRRLLRERGWPAGE